ncbi:YrhK family protein [Acuticoccus sp. M5D2P5]|uniref:YrhK family protein n=1 Tax=Acuticoccus kalidii TaxID=2910977 RepID=UPI001F3B10DE|nr:YrhK family protein [Acuticoccus kalidii]MCF3935120.1 YrhK family protein [Acuticoccus kalidii]
MDTLQHREQDERLFYPRGYEMSPRRRRVYATYELIYTLVDFGAAISFITGSVLFFSEALRTAGTWAFLIGSILFAVKPALRLARELTDLHLGRTETVAKRAIYW